jgi:hypothetical protein
LSGVFLQPSLKLELQIWFCAFEIIFVGNFS